MKERLTHIDNAKAIGMMLIVACHVIPSGAFGKSGIYETWCNILGSFHVPVFFLLSGIFASSKTDNRKMFARIVKLAKYVAIFYLFGLVVDLLLAEPLSLRHIRMRIGTVWFLFVLLWLEAIVGWIKRYKFSPYVFFALAIGGGIMTYYGRSFLFLGQALLCLPFYLTGYYAKDYLKASTFRWRICLGSFAVWLALFVLCYKPQNISVSIVGQNYLAFYAEAIAASICVLELSKLIKTKWLAYYGRNTIVVMMVQMTIIWALQKLVAVDSLLTYSAISIAACLLCGLAIPIFRNKHYDIFK